jgi:uncharacterized protein YecT (DUF1311 family)
MWLRMTGLAGASVAFLIIGCIAAAAAGAEPRDAPCEPSQSNLEYKNCLADLYDQADKELNVVWKQVLAKIDGANHLTAKQRQTWKAELRQAQRNWVQFKEHDCKGAVLYEWWGGSGAGGAISLCLLRYTRDRTEDLKERYLQ